MCNSSELHAGDIFYLPEYYKVRESGGDMLHVTDLDSGQHQNISKSILDESAETTGQFTKEEKVTVTKLASVLKGAGDSPFRVIFDKAPKEDEMVAYIDSQCALEDKTWGELPATKKRKIAKQCLVGQERTMHARLVRNEDGDSKDQELGRFQVVDLEQLINGINNAKRLVDSRTIKELILRGVRYHR